ncbi:MAG: D-alanyl-D-alanine carboxypeptidase family protein [Neisseria sp.]|uniref:D-alanyl-D-alanine carboxypeptidase family protein n=1 Tax=Neisseria sp. TaxID=192066 RepID=UPI0026DA7BF6|nr:D-alanyl-D-alanine carboxypeptidase family protein [Neisseria sp.]MDO4641209.1 D-alanyl-D-alanine carboxypeptidase family protein [Neisseria sp.]
MKKYLSCWFLAAVCAANAADMPKKDVAPAAKAALASATKPLAAPAAQAASSALSEKDAAALPKLPELAATAYAVMDAQSKQILGAHNPDAKIEPASLTKLMTAYLVFKALDGGTLKPDQMLKVSEKAWKTGGSRMFLSPNKAVSVSDLLKGMLVQSGNDATVTLAEALGNGSEAEFVKKMNEQAIRLGMLDTTFKNATGEAVDGHFSTVKDLLKLAASVAQDFARYYPIFSMKSFTYNGIEQPNRNLLLYRDNSIDGMISGHSPTAGYNLISSSNRNDRRVIAVLVGTESPEARAAESSKLLNWALQSFDTPKLYNAGQVISRVKVYKGSEKSVNVGFIEPVYLTIPHAEGQKIKPVLETVQPVVAPIHTGQELGKLKITYADKVLAERKVVALSPVKEANWFVRLLDNIKLWFKNIFS